MTAGNVLILGSIGRNFGAGMTGGLAFILDDDAWMEGRDREAGVLPLGEFVNKETVALVPLTAAHGAARAFIEVCLGWFVWYFGACLFTCTHLLFTSPHDRNH